MLLSIIICDLYKFNIKHLSAVNDFNVMPNTFYSHLNVECCCV